MAAFHPRYDVETSDFIALPVNGDCPLSGMRTERIPARRRGNIRLYSSITAVFIPFSPSSMEKGNTALFILCGAASATAVVAVTAALFVRHRRKKKV